MVLGEDVYQQVKASGLAWTDAEGTIHDIDERLEPPMAAHVWQGAMESINEANRNAWVARPDKFLTDPQQVKTAVRFHEELHVLFRRPAYHALLQTFRQRLETIFGEPLTETHPFIAAIRTVYGQPHGVEPPTHGDSIAWSLEEFVVLSIQEDTLFDQAVLPVMGGRVIAVSQLKFPALRRVLTAHPALMARFGRSDAERLELERALGEVQNVMFAQIERLTQVARPPAPLALDDATLERLQQELATLNDAQLRGLWDVWRAGDDQVIHAMVTAWLNERDRPLLLPEHAAGLVFRLVMLEKDLRLLGDRTEERLALLNPLNESRWALASLLHLNEDVLRTPFMRRRIKAMAAHPENRADPGVARKLHELQELLGMVDTVDLPKGHFQVTEQGRLLWIRHVQDAALMAKMPEAIELVTRPGPPRLFAVRVQDIDPYKGRLSSADSSESLEEGRTQAQRLREKSEAGVTVVERQPITPEAVKHLMTLIRREISIQADVPRQVDLNSILSFPSGSELQRYLDRILEGYDEETGELVEPDPSRNAPLVGPEAGPAKGPDLRGGQSADYYESLIAQRIREGLEQATPAADVAQALTELAASAAMTGEILTRLVAHFSGPVEAAYLQDVLWAWSVQEAVRSRSPDRQRGYPEKVPIGGGEMTQSVRTQGSQVQGVIGEQSVALTQTAGVPELAARQMDDAQRPAQQLSQGGPSVGQVGDQLGMSSKISKSPSGGEMLSGADFRAQEPMPHLSQDGDRRHPDEIMTPETFAERRTGDGLMQEVIEKDVRIDEDRRASGQVIEPGHLGAVEVGLVSGDDRAGGAGRNADNAARAADRRGGQADQQPQRGVVPEGQLPSGSDQAVDIRGGDVDRFTQHGTPPNAPTVASDASSVKPADAPLIGHGVSQEEEPTEPPHSGPAAGHSEEKPDPLGGQGADYDEPLIAQRIRKGLEQATPATDGALLALRTAGATALAMAPVLGGVGGVDGEDGTRASSEPTAGSISAKTALAAGSTIDARSEALAWVNAQIERKQQAFLALINASLEERLDAERAVSRIVEFGGLLAGVIERVPDEELSQFMAERIRPVLQQDARRLNFLLAVRNQSGVFRQLQGYIAQSQPPDFLIMSAANSTLRRMIEAEPDVDYFYLSGLPIVVKAFDVTSEQRWRLEEASRLTSKSPWLSAHPDAFKRLEAIVADGVIDVEADGCSIVGHVNEDVHGVLSVSLGEHAPVEIAGILIHEVRHLETHADPRLARMKKFEAEQSPPVRLRTSWVTKKFLWSNRPSDALNELQSYGTDAQFLVHLWRTRAIGPTIPYVLIEDQFMDWVTAQRVIRSLSRLRRLGRLSADGETWLAELTALWREQGTGILGLWSYSIDMSLTSSDPDIRLRGYRDLKQSLRDDRGRRTMYVKSFVHAIGEETDQKVLRLLASPKAGLPDPVRQAAEARLRLLGKSGDGSGTSGDAGPDEPSGPAGGALTSGSPTSSTAPSSGQAGAPKSDAGDVGEVGVVGEAR